MSTEKSLISRSQFNQIIQLLFVDFDLLGCFLLNFGLERDECKPFLSSATMKIVDNGKPCIFQLSSSAYGDAGRVSGKSKRKAFLMRALRLSWLNLFIFFGKPRSALFHSCGRTAFSAVRNPSDFRRISTPERQKQYFSMWFCPCF